MRNKRSAQVATSDDDESPPTSPPSRRRLRKHNDDDHEQEDDEEKHRKRRKHVRNQSESDEEDEEKDVEDDEEDPPEDAKPIGESVRVSGKGRTRRTHFESFELDGNQYDLEDPVLLVPEDQKQKPYVAIIKDVSQSLDGSLMVTGQWFYRPEEAKKKGGGNWQSRDIRELFYSFHRDEVPAESVMHKCVVHFVPLNKQLPKRKEHPGFIVQRVYDTVEQKLWKLTDKDYEDNKQHEINLLVDKTRSRIGEFQDIETTEGIAPVLDDQLKSQRALRKKNISPLDVTKVDDLHLKPDTPASRTSKENSSEHYTILKRFSVLTGDTHRDKWLEKLLQGIFDSKDTAQKVDKEKGGSVEVNNANESDLSETVTGSHENNLKGRGSSLRLDDIVPAVSALEKASHEALASDFSKYNQKMRQLVFNLSNNAALTRRLLNGELVPSKILSMSPTELKEGLTAEELAVKEPEESARMQMTDARCKRCQEKQVGLLDIIQAGLKARYQLECFACGNNWYVSGDEASTLTIDEPTTEKILTSPRDSDKPPVSDALKKTTEAYMPVLESQKSFSKSRNGDTPTKKTE